MSRNPREKSGGAEGARTPDPKTARSRDIANHLIFATHWVADRVGSMQGTQPRRNQKSAPNPVARDPAGRGLASPLAWSRALHDSPQRGPMPPACGSDGSSWPDWENLAKPR